MSSFILFSICEIYCTLSLKAENQMEWVCRMNNIRERVNEVVNAEMIFS